MLIRLYASFAIAVACAAGAVLILIAGRLLDIQFGPGPISAGSLGVVAGLSIVAGLLIGGQLADHDRSAKWLHAILIATGLVYMLPPFLDKPLDLIRSLLGSIAGPPVAAIVMLAIPGVLLASTIPFGIRVASPSCDGARASRTGAATGAIVALGAMGGAMSARLLCLPWIGMKATASAIAATLIVLGVIGLVLERGGRAAWLGLLLIFAALSPVPPPAPEGLVLAAQTDSGPAWVVEGTGPAAPRRIFVRGAPISSEGGRVLASHLDEGAPPHPGRRMLAIGVEGIRWRESVTSLWIVERDPGFAALAREGLGFPNVETGDARAFLAATEESFDWIVFSLLREPPPHWVTREAFETAAARLGPSGMLAVILHADPRGARAGALYRTIRAVFPHVRVFVDPAGGGEETDVEILASQNDLGLAIARSPGLAAHEVPAPDGTVLTDDRNPFEVLEWR